MNTKLNKLEKTTKTARTEMVQQAVKSAKVSARVDPNRIESPVTASPAATKTNKLVDLIKGVKAPKAVSPAKTVKTPAKAVKTPAKTVKTPAKKVTTPKAAAVKDVKAEKAAAPVKAVTTPKAAAPVKPAKAEKVAKTEKPVKAEKAAGMATPPKEEVMKTMRLSKGARTHERRMKAAARKEGTVYHSLLVHRTTSK